MPFRTRRSFTRGTPRTLFGSIGFDGGPIVVTEFVAHDSRFRFRTLDHGLVRDLNSMSAYARGHGRTALSTKMVFDLRRHTIGNIPFIAEDRQKRPKVGSVLGCFARRNRI